MNFRKILLAVDASDNSSRAVEYTGEIIGGADGFQVELLYVERQPERDIYPDETAWVDACQMQKEEVTGFLDEARERLLKTGIRPANVSVKYLELCDYYGEPHEPGFRGVAHQIMQAQKAGGFGTLVVGRRGVSKAEEFLFGSVSTKIIHHSRGCSVWVVE